MAQDYLLYPVYDKHLFAAIHRAAAQYHSLIPLDGNGNRAAVLEINRQRVVLTPSE